MTHTARVQNKLWQIYRRMDQAALTQERDDDADPVGLESREGRTRLAWGVYSREGLAHALEAYGTLDRLEARGLGKLTVQLELADPFVPQVLVRSERFAPPLVEISLRQVTGRQLELGRALAGVPLLYLESLVLQNPGRTFDWRRPPLPGQQFPGLHLSSEILQLLLLMAKRVGAEGMALRPISFHAAWTYSRHFRFVDGAAQGRFEALRSEPRLRPLWLLCWALELGCLRSGGERVSWTPDLMVAPLDSRLARAVETPRRLAALRKARRSAFRLDLDCLRQRFPWERMPPPPVPKGVRELLRPPPREA